MDTKEPNRELKRRIALIDLLKRKTDYNHPMSQANLRQLPGAEDILGYKGTFTRMLREIADVYNWDENGELLPKEEWRIVYPGYVSDKENPRNGKIYYNHPISEEEMSFLLSAVASTSQFTEQEKENLANKLKKELQSEHFQYDTNHEIAELYNPGNSVIPQNIQVLRDAIRRGKMVHFYECIVDEKGKLKHMDSYIRKVSPHAIVSYRGILWMFGNWTFAGIKDHFTGIYENYGISAFRVDRMEGLEIATTRDDTVINKVWAKDQRHRIEERRWGGAGFEKKARHGGPYVKNLALQYPCYIPHGMLVSELGSPIRDTVRFKIHWEQDHVQDYSFLYDSFGETFHMEENEICCVSCEPDLFVSWVMSYAHMIELVGNDKTTEYIRGQIAERLEKANRLLQIGKKKE